MISTEKVGGGGNLVTGDNFYREYNALNQMISVKEGNDASGRLLEEYSYDSNGDRIKTIRHCYSEDCSNETIYTPYKEWMRIVNSSGSFDFYYVYQGDSLVARKNADGTTYYYHPDHLGSTSLITDENGNVVEDEFYSPFGESLDSNDAEEFKLYTSQFKDSTGQYYYGARYYMPEWGRFVMVDTSIPNPYVPQYLNRYAYVLNNPYAYTDSSGQRIDAQQENYNGQEITAIYEDSVYIGKVTSGDVTRYEFNAVINGQDTGVKIPIEQYDYIVQRDSKFWTPSERALNEFLPQTESLSDITIRNQKKLLREENLEWVEAGIYDIATAAKPFVKGTQALSYISGFGNLKSAYLGFSGGGFANYVGAIPIPGTSTLSNWLQNNQGYQPYTKIESYRGSYTIGKIGGSRVTVTRSGSIVTRWGKSGRGTGGAYCKKGCG